MRAAKRAGRSWFGSEGKQEWKVHLRSHSTTSSTSESNRPLLTLTCQSARAARSPRRALRSSVAPRCGHKQPGDDARDSQLCFVFFTSACR